MCYCDIVDKLRFDKQRERCDILLEFILKMVEELLIGG